MAANSLSIKASKIIPNNCQIKKVPKVIIKAYSEGGNPSLDGGYTVFGQVISGMETVDKIASVEVTKSDQPKEKLLLQVSKLLKTTNLNNSIKNETRTFSSLIF